jgi:hypothetical protein
MQILRIVSNGGKVNGYPAAAALSLSIGPFTRLAMIPTNFELIEMNEKRVRKRSERSASESESQEVVVEERNAEVRLFGRGRRMSSRI